MVGIMYVAWYVVTCVRQLFDMLCMCECVMLCASMCVFGMLCVHVYDIRARARVCVCDMLCVAYSV